MKEVASEPARAFHHAHTLSVATHTNQALPTIPARSSIAGLLTGCRQQAPAPQRHALLHSREGTIPGEDLVGRPLAGHWDVGPGNVDNSNCAASEQKASGKQSSQRGKAHWLELQERGHWRSWSPPKRPQQLLWHSCYTQEDRLKISSHEARSRPGQFDKHLTAIIQGNHFIVHWQRLY